MTQAFIDQNYLIIESNVVTNVVFWNGNTSTWTPPSGSIALIQATTPAMIWQLNPTTKVYELVKQTGVGGIGFTWDGSVLTTNEPQPEPPVLPQNQPSTTGTQSA
jgi:hypothetical protein